MEEAKATSIDQIGKALLRSAVILGVSCISTPAYAVCWAGGDQEVAKAQALADTNPRAALPFIDRMIASAKGGRAERAKRLGWLLGAKSAAASLVSDYALAQKAANEGLEIAKLEKNKALEIEMIIRRIQISEPSLSQAALQQSLTRLFQLRSEFPATSRESICASTGVSILQITLGDYENALKTAGEAYRNAKKSGEDDAGALATIMLSVIALSTGDRKEADALANEFEKWARSKGYQAMVIHGIYQRATIAMASNRLEDAAKAFEEVINLSGKVGMPESDGAVGACESYIRLSRPKKALPFCRSAARSTEGVPAGVAFRTDQFYAEALLRTGARDEAKQILDRLMSMKVPGMLGPRYDKILELRALAYSMDGEFKKAYELQLEASKNATARRNASREEEIAKLRAQFGWDRQRIANAELERDLAKTAAQARVRQTWLLTAIGWTVLLVAMLIWIVYSSRRHRRRLEALANEAREIARSKADLLSTMSHEIRSPLGSLTLAASNLANSNEIPVTSKDKALRVSVAAERLLRQLEDLLLFSRLDAKQLPLAVQSFEPQSLVERSASLLVDQANAVGIAIDVIINERTPIIVEGDSGRVSQIVSNLLENAIKHSGGSRIEVQLGAESADRYFIEVSDNGHGMSDECRNRAMQKFVQVGKPSSSGFGLGLSICKGLSDLMGGGLSLLPSASGGLAVRLDLPVIAVEAFTSRAAPSALQTNVA